MRRVLRLEKKNIRRDKQDQMGGRMLEIVDVEQVPGMTSFGRCIRTRIEEAKPLTLTWSLTSSTGCNV